MSQESLDQPLESLELSVGATMALDKTGMRYLGELVQMSEDELRDVGCAPAVLTEIAELLDELSLSLDMDVGDWAPPDE